MFFLVSSRAISTLQWCLAAGSILTACSRWQNKNTSNQFLTFELWFYILHFAFLLFTFFRSLWLNFLCVVVPLWQNSFFRFARYASRPTKYEMRDTLHASRDAHTRGYKKTQIYTSFYKKNIRFSEKNGQKYTLFTKKTYKNTQKSPPLKIR